MNRLYAILAAWRPRWSNTVFKAVLISMPIVALVTPIAIVALPFNEFMNDMAAQPKGKAQMTFGRLDDAAGFGQILARDPVAGTMPREYVPYRFDHLPAELKAAQGIGNQLRSPLPVTMEHMRSGERLFGIYCSVCHGNQGYGNGPVIGPDRFPAPPSLHTEQTRGYPDGTMFHLITKGTKIMPGYAGKLDESERWQVIQYLRALHRAQNPQPKDLL